MSHMKYIDLRENGGAEMMCLREGTIPPCGAGDLLIRVLASGVNRPDILQRQGFYAPPQGASPVMGLEAAGEIVQVGSAVDGWSEGDHVCGLCNGGAYAEYVAVPATQCLPIPAGLTMIQAASLPETFFTVWGNVFMRGHLKTGESLLIHGGTSGIGVTAIQLAKAFGATVYVTARGSDKCRACEEIGADKAIDSTSQDFVEEIMNVTKGIGVNMILDMVGGDYIKQNISCAAFDGKIISIAFLAGAKVEVNFMPVMIKRLTLTGSTLRPQNAQAKAAIASDILENVWPMFQSGSIKPVIHKCFALSEVADAHRMMESNQHIGKIVLSVA